MLRSNMAGPQPGRSRSIVHASDITKPDFCPRAWAFADLEGTKISTEYVNTAMAVTWSMGRKTAQTLIEDWAGNKVIGNWKCIRCGAQSTFTRKPNAPDWPCKGGFGKDFNHIWEYVEVMFAPDMYQVSGSIDAFFDVGTPKLMATELKIMAPDEFEKIHAPLPEHRLRTSLYLHLIAASDSPYKDRINLNEARVLVVSRGYGKMNTEWSEILPFREFEVTRDDASLAPYLQRAKAVKLWRKEKTMPSGICGTALDKYAKKCDFCTKCFSGEYPALVQIESL